MQQWLVIGVSGVTCGGKTTLAHALRVYFQGQKGLQLWSTPYTVGDVQLISQDDYFLPVDDVRHKWNKKLNVINFEVLDALDMKKMLSDVSWIMKGHQLANESLENIDFMNEKDHLIDFSTKRSHSNHSHSHGQNHSHNHHKYHSCLPQPQQQKQTPSSQQQQQQSQHHIQPHHYQPKHHNHHNHGRQLTFTPHIMRVNPQISVQSRDSKVHVLIIEGFLIFNHPELFKLCNIKFHIHLPYEKCFERRKKRTYDPPDITGYFEVCVWPHYEKNFQDVKDRKDIEFLNGEISKDRIFKYVLQKIATYFEERCDVPSPPPHKFLGMLNSSASVNISLKPTFRCD